MWLCFGHLESPGGVRKNAPWRVVLRELRPHGYVSASASAEIQTFRCSLLQKTPRMHADSALNCNEWRVDNFIDLTPSGAHLHSPSHRLANKHKLVGATYALSLFETAKRQRRALCSRSSSSRPLHILISSKALCIDTRRSEIAPYCIAAPTSKVPRISTSICELVSTQPLLSTLALRIFSWEGSPPCGCSPARFLNIVPLLLMTFRPASTITVVGHVRPERTVCEPNEP